MKRMILTSVAILGLSGTAFAGMINAPGTFVDPSPSIWQQAKTQKMADNDVDQVRTGSIPAAHGSYLHGMYVTPRSNLLR